MTTTEPTVAAGHSLPAIAEIWTRSRDTALARVEVLEDAVTALIEGRLSQELRRQAERAAHQLAGSAGTFGFSSASASARHLEWTLAGTQPLTGGQALMAADEVIALRSDLEREPTAAATPHAAAPTTPTSRRLLVAVAEPHRRDEIEAAACGRGFATIAVSDLGEDGHRATAAALVDLGLPGDEGFRLLEQLGSADPPVPTLALTPNDAFTDRVAAARAGARGFLPAAVPCDELLNAVEGMLERSRRADTTVLVVDDDPMVLAALETVLGAAGMRTVALTDPSQFWSALVRERPDLVVVDLAMPGVTGDELCRVVRSDPDWAGLPILVLTASTDPQTVNAVFAAGADDFIAKPFAGPELLARIGNRLARTRLFEALADTDALTGLANRRRSESDLQLLLGLADRHQQPVSLAAIDLDRFKQVNDRHGHAVGDAVLRRIGALLAACFRGDDVVARWGGEEFVVGMYGMARDDGVQRIASVLETLRDERFPTPDGGGLHATFSAGVAVYPHDGATLADLYRAADDALYRAKKRGRDRVLAVAPNAPEHDADVVIVEDDEVLVELLTHALTTHGYRVRHIGDGQQAAQQLAAGPACLQARVVLLDVDLPTLSGLGVLRHMAQAGTLADTRVIVLTARSSEPEVVEALALGAFDHVAKPFSVPVLMQRIRRALQSP